MDQFKFAEKHYNLEDIGTETSQRRMDFSALEKYRELSLYLKATLFILVEQGNATIEINFKTFEVKQQQILLLAAGHFFKIKSLDEHITIQSMYVTEEYIKEMYSSDMIYKKAKYGAKMFKQPILNLASEESVLLKKRMEFVGEAVRNSDHLFHQEMILRSINIFFLDLSNIIENKTSEAPTKIPRDEIYFQKFLTILAEFYKERHLVNFYAEQLNITPHYLTLIVKRLTGQTVSDFIFQLINSEARLLLKQPMLSIQEISDLLHFSDQSAFGKFFKRKNGISPKSYRSEYAKNN